MGSIEDNLKRAWEALREKKKTVSVKEQKKDEKTDNSKEESSKKAVEKEKTEKKGESLEETVKETASHMPAHSSSPAENFFANKPSEGNNFQPMKNEEKKEKGDRTVLSYASTPKQQEEKGYSPSSPRADILKVEMNPFQEQRAFERSIRPVRQILPEGVMPVKNEEILKVQDFDRPYDSPLKSNPLEKKYKLLK